MDVRSRSRVAAAGLTLAVVGTVVVFLAGFGYRHEWWSLRVAFGRRFFGVPLLGVLPIGTLLALLGALWSLAGIAHARRAALRGLGLATAGLVVGTVPSLMVLHHFRLARRVPPINDVSTDLATPPAYVTAAANEFWQGKEMSYPAGFADSVRRGYPDLAPLVVALPAGRGFALARKTAARMGGWEVTGADSAAGRIEATATTRWFGFKDDVVIRVTPRGADSVVVDMRSKSRVGRSDVGANAARIRAYLAGLARAAS
jgi:uncharacterized protein (DUF1499 family)